MSDLEAIRARHIGEGHMPCDVNTVLAALDEAGKRLASLDEALAARGLEGVSVAGLLRHERNNEAATQGGWKARADTLAAQNAALVEATPEAAQGQTRA